MIVSICLAGAWMPHDVRFNHLPASCCTHSVHAAFGDADQYGGSIENRCHFCIEVVKAVVDEVGSDVVGIRLSPFTEFYGANETGKPLQYLTQRLQPTPSSVFCKDRRPSLYKLCPGNKSTKFEALVKVASSRINSPT